jgi:hypothetical protein
VFGAIQSLVAPRRRQFIQAAQYDAARRRNRTQYPQLPDGFSSGGSEAIVVSGLAFTGIGAVIGYVLGHIEAENHYSIKHGQDPTGPGRTSAAEQ